MDAAFLAGAGLAALDSIVCANPPWAGAWRQRLALSAAASSAGMAGRREDEAALRDAWYLRRPDQDPGPAGRIFGAWRRLARSHGVFELVGEAAAAFGLPAEGILERLASLQGLASEPPLVAAAEAATLVMAARPNSEMLALLVADAVLAERLRWPNAVPLLAGQIVHPASKIGAVGRRPRPGDSDWLRSSSFAYARAAASACDLAAELARRAEKLQAVAPKLRAKGAGAVIAALLNEDALTTASPFGAISERGRRRLFDRLVTLGAIRELSGRETFRLYGL
ncbi:Protein of unknown function [Rhizobiales bacterium GAS188]|nr:Protein of unknown function [Rhizobiales bacterium GAS188]SEF06911.1 Protein of unknown function [Rhizobiales bacterium GAS188]